MNYQAKRRNDDLLQYLCTLKYMFRQQTIYVDRDSVAAGDDMESHAYTLKVRQGTYLSALLDTAAPHMGGTGWSWVAFADGQAVAVWSIDHGVQMFVTDRRVTKISGPLNIVFRYFLQVDPSWLHNRLMQGAPPDRDVLGEEYRPLQEQRWEEGQRQRERDTPDRLISVTCIDILNSFGAKLDLHNDRMLRFDLCGDRWTVYLTDTMTGVSWGSDGHGASIRPVALAENFLVTAVAAVSRESVGVPRFPDIRPKPMPELRSMSNWPPELKRWSTIGEPVFQLAGEDAVSYFRFANGRSLEEIASLMAY